MAAVNWAILQRMVRWLETLFKRPQRDALGDRGENMAARFLRNLGYKIIVRNFRCELGEIDIVAKDGPTLVFVEVKTRAYDDPTPEEQIDEAKQHQITKAAKTYLARYGLPQPPARSTWLQSSGQRAGSRRSAIHRTPSQRPFDRMIDSHCHLTDPRLHSQLDAVLERAATVGVVGMVSIGTTPADARDCIALCRRHPNLRCAAGLHPNYVTDESLASIPELRELQSEVSVIALGEMGLDYFHETAAREKQHAAFEQQLQIAVEVGRPVVIHCREAMDDCLAVLRSFPVSPGRFPLLYRQLRTRRARCWTRILLGFTGPITFKKNDALRDVVRADPRDRVLVETDSPYLTPEPMRKHKINEPAMVVHVAAEVGRVKGWSLEETDAITSENGGRSSDGRQRRR